MKTALLVIDIQKDYFPDGKFPLVEPLAAAQNAYTLLQCFREHGGHHVHIQHISREPDADFFVRGDSGSDIHDSVAHFEGEPIVYKHFPNSFLQTNLLDMLKEWGVERVVITGMMTHMCVDTTTRAAFDLGFTCHLAHDACATRDLAHEGNTVDAAHVQTAYMAALGQVFAKVVSTQEMCAALA